MWVHVLVTVCHAISSAQQRLYTTSDLTHVHRVFFFITAPLTIWIFYSALDTWLTSTLHVSRHNTRPRQVHDRIIPEFSSHSRVISRFGHAQTFRARCIGEKGARCVVFIWCRNHFPWKRGCAVKVRMLEGQALRRSSREKLRSGMGAYDLPRASPSTLRQYSFDVRPSGHCAGTRQVRHSQVFFWKDSTWHNHEAQRRSSGTVQLLESQ